MTARPAAARAAAPGLSPIGEAVLIAREGRRLRAYRDAVGVWTIGIGHTSAAGAPAVTQGLTITAAECDAIFARDLARYARAVDEGVRVPLPSNARDALISVCYNIGPAAFARSTFLARLNGGDLAGARAALLWWNRPAAIRGRREAEAEQLVTPYAQCLPRATSAVGPIVIAGSAADALNPKVATPPIVTVFPRRRLSWLARFWTSVDAVRGGRARDTA